MVGIATEAIGDSAIKVTFTGEVSPELNAVIQAYCSKLENSVIEGIIEWVPAFNSVTVYFEPQRIMYNEISEKMHELYEMPSQLNEGGSRIIHVPVLYGGKYGPDLNRVAAYNQLTVNEVIEIHQHPEYLVYMIGFLPGFPYLGGLDKRIAAPRLKEPRANTVAGAVGIAHKQTGIYPVESPGGWNIIGKTPVQLFDNGKIADAFLFHAGDRVRFYSVSESEFDKIEEQTRSDVFDVRITER